jgi:hypothetical protein
VGLVFGCEVNHLALFRTEALNTGDLRRIVRTGSGFFQSGFVVDCFESSVPFQVAGFRCGILY